MINLLNLTGTSRANFSQGLANGCHERCSGGAHERDTQRSAGKVSHVGG